MFKIIGSDQKQYGPVTAEHLRQWILTGRANAQTLVQAEGSLGWKALSECPEFSDLLAKQSAGGPGALPGAKLESQTCGMAIASLVLGLLGVCGITAVVGLVLGVLSLRKINRSHGQLSGQGFAIAGICLSAFMLLFSIPFLAGMTLPAVARAKQKAQAIKCMSNIKQLCLATMMYANDHNDRLPEATAWCDLIQPYLGGTQQAFLCPAGDKAVRCHYAFNAKLNSVETKASGNPMLTVLIFETEGGWNASGGPEQLLKHSRHGRGIVVGFADGHAEVVLPTRLDKLVW